jgi:hypothetical protein
MSDFVVPTQEEQAELLAAFAALGNPWEEARTALSDAAALASLYPAPTPEETALIDSQINSALIGFQGLSNPPADVVALAAAVISWRSTL